MAAVTIEKQQDIVLPGMTLRIGVASFNSTDATDTLAIGLNRKVWGFFANWLAASNLNSSVPQINGTSTGGRTLTDASGNVTLSRNDTTSGQKFWFMLFYF